MSFNFTHRQKLLEKARAFDTHPSVFISYEGKRRHVTVLMTYGHVT